LNQNPPYPETADIETSSEAYASRFYGDVGKWFLKVQEEATLRMISHHYGANVLDVGGGHGQLTDALINNGFQVTVFGSAEVCKTRIQNFLEDQRCSFKVGNILQLPYDDQEFDIVISYRLLAHVNKWQDFLAELSRVASRSVVIDYPEARSFNALTPYFFDYKKKIERNTRRYHIFCEADLFAIFQARNFYSVSKFKEFFFPMAFHRKLNAPRISITIENVCRSIGLTDFFGSPIILEFVRGED
jgi:ubiquinone/menaquinone biosynthesis C-methylase UbiE